MPQPANANLRSAQPRHGVWLAPLTLVIQSALFLGMNSSLARTVDLGWLAYISLVPWLVWLLRGNARGVYVGSYALGVFFYLINTAYLRHITVAGYLALAIYFGLSYLFVAWVVRHGHGLLGLPVLVVIPVAWVAGEYLRGIGPLAFPFLFLSHAVYQQLTVIQISDLVGAYGVSFVVAIVNAMLAGIWSPRTFRIKPNLPSACAAALVLAATLLYGIWQLQRGDLEQGPAVAVLQGDYPLSVNAEQASITPQEKAMRYMGLMQDASQHQPALYLFPETPWLMTLNDGFLEADKFPVNGPFYEGLQAWSRQCDSMLASRAKELNAYVVIGASAMDVDSTAVTRQYRKYNSAYVYDPHQGQKGRYDKVRLVMFGEYTPFFGSETFHPLYRWLDSFNPFSSPDDEFSLTPGSEYKVFDLIDAHGQTFRFSVPICFEDLIPSVARKFAHGQGQNKGVDFLLSISNDGWFSHGSIVPQHLAVCVFRAVENRVGIARSVNTACSGFIDPRGRIHNVVNDGGRVLGRHLFGYEVASMTVDRKRTFYTRWGDWFGALCTIAALALVVFSKVSARLKHGN